MNQQEREIYEAMAGTASPTQETGFRPTNTDPSAAGTTPTGSTPTGPSSMGPIYTSPVQMSPIPPAPAPSDPNGGFKRGLLLGLLVAFSLSFMVWGGVRVGKALLKDRTEQKQESQISDLLDQATTNKLSEIEMLLKRYYLFDYTDQDLQEGIVKGMVNSLGDPYTVYYNEEETKELEASTSGQYSGVGAVLTQNMETMAITVTRVYKNAPAAEAGVQEGDVLYKVDDRDITGMEVSKVVTYIRGEEGTEVTLTVIRDEEEVSIPITRRKVDVETVEYRMLENQVGYIAISGFEEVTLSQFQTALQDLQAQGMKAVVFDLRNNPGGLLNICCDMLDELLPKGLLVYTKDKNDKITEYNSSGDDSLDIPIVLLVNGNSASASEIFTGALKDRADATVIGTTTYGKGIVQSILDLGDGTSLKVTISEYFTPNGTEIHKIGITPDYEVEENEKDENGETVDAPLEKALEVLGADR